MCEIRHGSLRKACKLCKMPGPPGRCHLFCIQAMGTPSSHLFPSFSQFAWTSRQVSSCEAATWQSTKRQIAEKNSVQIAKLPGAGEELGANREVFGNDEKVKKPLVFAWKTKDLKSKSRKNLANRAKFLMRGGGFRGGPSQRSWAPPTDEILFRPPPKATSHTCWPGHKTESQRSWAPLTDEGTSRKRGSSQRKGLVICIFPFCRSKLHA